VHVQYAVDVRRRPTRRAITTTSIMTHLTRTLSNIALCCAAMASAHAQASPVAESVTIPRAPGELVGTLLVPHATVPVPVVLIISGSGATDRDGNGGGFAPAPLRQLAESLATRNIATLRYDKRSIGGSASAAIPEAQMTLGTFADDAAAWIRYLESTHRFSRVIVAGHSEGALLGLLAMQQVPAAGYISVEGMARPLDQVLHDQLAAQLPAPMLAQTDSIFARLRRGETVDSLVRSLPPAVGAALFRPSVQPFLVSEFKHAGQVEITHLAAPCLIVQGTRDLQIAPSEADLLHRANPRCTVALIPDMNHMLKQTTATDLAGQLSTYRAPDAPLAAGLVDAVAKFVLASSH